MLTLIEVLAVSWVLFSALGWGLHLLVTPRRLDLPLLRPVLWFCYGQALFAVVNVYAWSLDLGIRAGLVLALVVAAVLAGVAVRRDRHRPLRDLRESGRSLRRQLPAVVVIALSVLVLVVPGYASGLATSPYRTGIDQVGYTVPADTLLHGATRSTVLRGLREQTGNATDSAAYADVRRAVSFNQQVDGEFLLVGLRRSFSQAVAAVSVVVRPASVWQVSFLLPALATLALAGLVAGLLRGVARTSRPVAVAGALLVALNANLLNVWYEGGYGQTWVSPLALLAVGSVVALRRDAAAGASWREGVPLAGVIAVSLAGILPAYADLVTALVGVMALTSLFDVLVGAWSSLRAMIVAGVGAAAGAVLTAPFTLEFLRYAPTRYRDAGVGGFWQAHWATPAEIAGLSDMYKVPGYVLVAIDRQSLRVLVLLSLAVLVLVFLTLRGLPAVDTRLLYGLVAFVLLVFYRTRFEVKVLNYQYFKVYTYLLPALVLLVVAGLDARRRRRGAPPPVEVLAWLLVVLVAFVGLNFVRTMRAQDHVVTADMMSLRADDAARQVLTDTAIAVPVQPNDVDLTADLFAGVAPMNWVNRSPDIKVGLRPDLPVAVALIAGEPRVCLPCLRRAHPSADFLLDRRAVVLVSAHATLRQVTDGTGAFSPALLHKALVSAHENDMAALFPAG